MRQAICTIVLWIVVTAATAQAAELTGIQAKSALLMAADGTVLFEQNADESLPPASVTRSLRRRMPAPWAARRFT